MARYSQTPEVEAALADLFGPRINELLPDRDINDFALNWDAAANECALYIRQSSEDWICDGAIVDADAVTAIARMLATEAGVSLNPLAAMALHAQSGERLDEIATTVARAMRIPPAALSTKSRTQHLAFARQVAVFLCRKITGTPFKAIGAHFGGRHHATVIHACRLIESRIERDAAFKRFTETLEQQITFRTAGMEAAA